jgi:cobalt-zinc-cadmium efflux system protein
MGDHHGHSHSAPDLAHLNRAFYIGIALNLAFTIAEFTVGILNNSLALIADAGHNLSDVASLIISLIGLKLAQKAASLAYTYGYKKASILASLINAVLLIVIVINIFIEAVERLYMPPELMGDVIIVTATIGVVINTVSAFLFFKGQKEDINVKGAFIHLMVDAVMSVAVVIAGIIIHYTGWNIVDPLISILIGIVILVVTWSLFRESLKLTLDGVPKGIDVDQIKYLISENEHIKEVNHIHIWALSSSTNALTAHLILHQNNLSTEEVKEIKNNIKHELEHKKIQHVTLEID